MSKVQVRFNRLTSTEVHSSRLHHLHRVKLFSAALCHVTQGSKVIVQDENRLVATSRSLIILPANTALEIINQPENGSFNSDLLLLSPELLSRFKQQYLSSVTPGQLTSLCAPFSSDLSYLWSAVLNAVRNDLSASVQEHLVMGLLLVLHQEGLAGPLLIEPRFNLTEQVRQLILFAPATQWSVDDVASQLSLGASTLRRRLQNEGQNFRQIVEEVRMTCALSLLQSTRLPVAEIALKCGYLSGSRFTARFHNHYGCLPKNIR
ncbi:AraC family transcriptional regulator [uncultured Cedecea sp.]|uniref:AraC family transcriptional regulator n=1 Tax=uncultured Cedecea sp. TaxID=988762 RepID=UPI002638EF47|nr:AraC family transcriptional regulator [uncultured Cedecea sp.]